MSFVMSSLIFFWHFCRFYSPFATGHALWHQDSNTGRRHMDGALTALFHLRYQHYLGLPLHMPKSSIECAQCEFGFKEGCCLLGSRFYPWILNTPPKRPLGRSICRRPLPSQISRRLEVTSSLPNSFSDTVRVDLFLRP